MHYTFVSPVSCYVGVKTFLMYALYFCQPCLMLCRCEDFLMYVLYFCQPSLMLCRWEDLSDVCTILFQPCLMLCRCEDLSDVGTILFSALSHVMQVWRSFWCMYHTFVSPVSCYVGVKIFLMYALYFCQSCIVLCRCEDLSDVCTILLSALSHVM